ncbi:hypothetical protein [Streptomyces sp. NPDC048659]|uniref:hypothetical protein n=1 Tax=Streptomyces sp. NPDC048659 TaxID=3155489 RepID=UPI00342F6265
MTAGGTAALPAAAAGSGGPIQDARVSATAAAGQAFDESTAKAAAEASEQQVEVTGLRQERREVFANPDGSFTAHEYTQPIRTRRGNSWVPVDDTLVRRADGGWSPSAATVDVEFSDGGQGPFARMSKVGREYALSWPGAPLPKPRVDGNTARYEEVLPGVDLAVRADVEGFAHYLVVKNAQAAANPELDSIELGLSTKGVTVSKSADGALKATDSAVGGTVFEAAQARMWDSSADQAAARMPSSMERSAAQAVEPDLEGAGRQAPVGLDISGDSVTLTPDIRLLRGPDTVYPVVIDPIPRTTGTNAWTSVMSGMPSAQNWKFSGHAGMGKCPSNYNPTECSGIGVRRLLFSFPTSFYSKKQIISTSFSARVGAVYWADAKAEPIDLYRIGGANHTITSSSNWENTVGQWSDYLMTVNQKISPTACPSAANLHFSNGELLTQMGAAAAGGWSTMSLGLKAKDESTYYGWKRVCGNAYLSVTYNTPPRQKKMGFKLSSDIEGFGRNLYNKRQATQPELPFE